MTKDLGLRIEKLEHANRRLTLLALSGPLLLLLVSAVEQAPSREPKVITADAVFAREFFVSDQNGSGTVRITADEDGPAVILARKRQQVQMVVQTEPRLMMYTGDRSRAWFGLYDGAASVGLAGAKKDGSGIHVSADAGGSGAVSITDADGYSAVLGKSELVTSATGSRTARSAASLVMFGKDNRVIWSAP